jgi:tetratricopeptide (TPR) repeat protein
MSNTILSSVPKDVKVLKVLFLCFAALIPLSCIDYLDVRPENQILLEDFWQKESDIEGVLMACYRSMQEDDFMWRVITWGELRSDNTITTNGAGNDERQMNNANILPTNGLCSWTALYRIINYCNTILQYAPQVMEKDPDFTTADLQAKSAEALAIRALCYFYLVRTFRDVPLVEDATINDEQNLQIPQSNPETVLSKITDDLLQAEEWSLTGYPTTAGDKGRMSKDAIRALIADVYLWQKKYAECIEYCDKLINATTTGFGFSSQGQVIPKYQLIEEMSSAYIFSNGGNSSESIFELQFTTEKTNKALWLLYGDPIENKWQMTATIAYADGETIFPKTDERKADFIVVDKSDAGEYRIFKYLGEQMNLGSSHIYFHATTTPNWIFYRITDIMLMKAEALVQLQRSENDLKEALHIVNTTYMRANSTLLETDTLSFDNYGTQPTLEKLVLLERQRELMFEGKRWFDLLRHSERKNSSEDLVEYVLNKYDANVSTIASKLAVMNALYLPIHADELRANPLLKQNPYYETSSGITK